VKKIVAVLIVLFMVTSCLMMAGTVAAKGPGAEDKQGGHGKEVVDEGLGDVRELSDMGDFRPKREQAKEEGVTPQGIQPLQASPAEFGIIQLTANETDSIHPMFSPDGRKIAYMNDGTGTGNRSIWVMNADGTNKYNVTDADFQCAHLEGWSPDGTKLLYRSKDPNWSGPWSAPPFVPPPRNNLWLANADGSGVDRITNEVNGTCFGGWSAINRVATDFSPDGSKIAFKKCYYEYNTSTARWEWMNPDLWVMNADGSDQVQLTNTPGLSEQYPKWSPDGSKILYKRCHDEDPLGRSPSDLWVINADGTGAHPVVTDVGSRIFDWSPDGRWIVYERSYEAILVNTTHEFTSTPTATGAGTLNVSIRGDFNSDSEYADVYVESDYIGRLNPGSGWQCNVSWFSVVFPITQAQINTWNADGKIVVTVEMSYEVDYFCTYNQTRVNLTYAGYSQTNTKDFCPMNRSADVCKVRVDGTGNTRLTPSDDYCEHAPSWFHAGGSDVILYSTSDSETSQSMMVMNPDGSGKTVVHPWGNKRNHDVSPDGEWIVFQTCWISDTGNTVIYKVRNPLYTTKVPTLMPVGLIALIGLLSVIAAISIVRKREGK